MTAAVAGTDYLAPNGSAASLTNFPTFNQNTSGNAATSTKLAAPKNINGVAFDGSSDITITAAASTLSGTVQVSNGGTGVSTLTGLVKGNGANAMTAAVAGTDYLAPNGSAAEYLMADGSKSTSTSAATSGIWTVTSIIVSSSNNSYSNFTFIEASGFYQKVGNVVSFSLYISLSGDGYSSSYSELSNFEIALPVASNFTSVRDGSGTVSGSNSNYGDNIAGYVDANPTNDRLRINIQGAHGSVYNPTLAISGMYIVR